MILQKAIFVLSFIAFLFLSLSQFFFSISDSFYDSQRLAQAMLLCCVGVLFCFSARSFEQFTRADSPLLLPRIFSMMALVIGFGCISAVLSSDIVNSLMYVTLFALLFVTCLYLAVFLDAGVTSLVLCLVVVFHSGVIIYSTLFLGFAVFQGDSIKASIVYFGFDNIRFFNQAQVFVLPLLSYLLTVKRIAVAAHLILFANLMLMFVGGGLGIALCWSLMLFALLFFNRRLLVGLLVHTLVAFVSAYGLLNGFQLDEASSVSAQYLSDGGRLPIWLSVIDHLQWRHLLLGIGPGLYSDLSGVSSVGHPHNFLLEMLYEWGAVAVAIALLMVGWTMRLYFVHVYRVGFYSRSDAFFLSWLAGLLYSLVSGVLVMPVPQTLVFVCWGIVLGSIHRA
ncbi:hypothetical protein A3760_22665, partial [Oleiphilus sp. HI0122]